MIAYIKTLIMKNSNPLLKRYHIVLPLPLNKYELYMVHYS